MRIHQTPAVVLLLLLLAGVARAAEHTSDSLSKVRENLDRKKALLIDVREVPEWNRGHLEAALLLPLSELRKVTKDAGVREKVETALPKDRIIYCHCASGVRVLSAAYFLNQLGYDIQPLEAGFDDLRRAGFPAAAER